jgi:DNA-binding beta-propeller fold protein YncE
MHILALSFNKPKLPLNARWCENGTTFVNKSIIGEGARGFFVSYDDTVYIAAHTKSQILVLPKESNYSTRHLSVKLFHYTTLFVTMNGDIYFENGNERGRIDKWTRNATNSTVVMNFSGDCYGLFVDINNTLYCSMRDNHRIVKVSLDEKNASEITIAGTGSQGSAANQLCQPWGIFVDTNFDLYIADAINNRIQLFRPGELSGTTVAGSFVPQNLTLNLPTDVILDADGYLYIADNEHRRVIRSGHCGFECVIGCSGKSGSAPNELNKPYSIRFDSHGNLYVADEFNHRFQNFILATNSCSKCNRDTNSNVIPNPFSKFLIELFIQVLVIEVIDQKSELEISFVSI